jgi:tetratricopeptide repeat protein/SnoaL-like protein
MFAIQLVEYGYYQRAQYITMTIHNILLKKYITPILLTLLLASFSTFADELKDISKMAEQGQQEAALKRINTYLEANPKDAQGMFMKGIIQAESGKRDDAIKTFNTLTKTYPSLPEPYNNLAVLYAEAGEYDSAKKALETAIKTHPSYATAHENLGDIYARMASEAYDKALQLDTGNARAQSKLSLIKDLFTTESKTTVAANNATPIRPIRPANKKAEPETTPAAEAKPIAETKPVVETPKVNTATNAESDIMSAVEAWRLAWAGQDVDAYLASYADSFSPGQGRSLASWKEFRRSRVSGPKGITLNLNDPKVEILDESNAKVSFKQYYKADNRSAIHTNKTLVLKKVGGSWLINEEVASN